MGEFEIACKKVTVWAEKINGCSKNVKKQGSRVEDVLSQMRYAKDRYQGMEQTLYEIIGSMYRQQEQMQQYGDALENIVRAYENTETDILEKGMRG